MKNADSDYSEEGGDENAFDQSDNDEEEEKPEGSTLLDVKRLANEQKPPNNDKEVKLEEDEVKMEVESGSEGGDFEELSSSLDSSVAAKIASVQEGYNEQENMEKPKKRRKKRRPGENPYRGKPSVAPCEICGISFAQPSDMVKHMVTHTGARDYKCDICSESFPQMSIMNRFKDLLIN